MIDGLVDQWFDRCVTSNGRRRGGDRARARWPLEPPYLVRELLMAVWRRQNWPMQAMGMAKWDELAELALGAATPARRDFPGGVTVEVAAGTMRLRRDVPSPPGEG